MKKLVLMLLGIAATINVMAVDYTATAKITLSATSGYESILYLLQSDDFGALEGAEMYMDAVGMYVLNGTTPLQIAKTDNFTNVKVGLKTDVSTDYTITVSYVSGSALVLWDVVNNVQYPLIEGESYNFTATANATDNDRFVINYVAPAPDYGSYQRNVTVGNYGTICLPKAGTIAGGTLFNIGSYENDMIYIDEVGSVEMEAGKPYIFQASADQINVTYSSDVEVAAGEDNGLHGYFDANNYFVVPADAGNYILRSNQYWEVVSGQHVAYLNNYFAFIKISEINNQAPAPGRRRVGMAVNGAQVVTGIDELNAAEAPVKTVIDGKMYIIRGEHMFDATGRMVK